MAELFHRRYTVLDGLADASKIPTKMLNVFEHPELFSLERLQTMFDEVTFIFRRKEVLDEKVNCNLCNQIVKQSMESLDKDGRQAGTSRYLCTEEWSIEYVGGESGRVRSAKQRAKLDLWQEWINELLVPDSEKKHETWLLNSRGRFVIMGKDFL